MATVKIAGHETGRETGHCLCIRRRTLVHSYVRTDKEYW